MKKIIISVLVILGVIYVSFSLYQVVAAVILIPNNIQFATTTNDVGDTIKTGLKIPVGTETFDMNLGGYDSCRQKKTKIVCMGELRDDIRQNIETYQINKAREEAEKNRQNFEDEVNLNEI